MSVLRHRLYDGATKQRRGELDRTLAAARRSGTVTAGPSGPPQPPSWWRGEEYAYRQGLSLIANLSELKQVVN